jgi:type I restriction enzyme, S subunit
MNPAFFLAQFSRISDAPDAIQHLRRFIFQLAVRGKLVSQDPKDEPASELLKRIQAEKAESIKEGTGAKSQTEEFPDVKNVPYEIPPSWKWVMLGATVNRHFGGGTPSKNISAYWGGDILWASVKDVGKEKYIEETIDRITEAGLSDSSSNLIPPGNLIVVTRMGLGKVSINRVPIAINQDLRALCLSSFTAVDYHYIFFKTHGFAGTGLTVKGIKVEELLNVAFPLPPLAEQYRIVAKVDELMALCDQLEEARAERDKRLDHLTAASHYHLNNGANTEATRRHASFYLDNLRTMTIRPEQIPPLREAILNLAVTGRIILQGENDEPVSKLLERVRLQQQRLSAAGTIPKPKVRPSDARAELAFEPPKSWESIRFGRLCNIVTSGSRGWAEYYSESGPKFIRAQNIRFGKLRLGDLACVNPPKKSEGTRTRVSKGDLLVVITGAGVTNPALLDTDLGEAYVSQHVALIKPTDTNLSPWLLLCLMAPMGGRAELVTRAYGAGKPGLNLDNIRSLEIPLPPLSEQQRIVAKVDELMALCDRLETQLANVRDGTSRLLESVLHNTFNETEEVTTRGLIAHGAGAHILI